MNLVHVASHAIIKPMTRRTYHQFCPLAYSLDILGERWTLLIVRELLFGPRRYTDLLNGLPGIGTNLLAKRLKELEQDAVIQQRKLPPPASSTVYELTERGRGLGPVLQALVDWGLNYLQLPVPEEDFVGTIPLMGSFYIQFDRDAAAGINLTCEIHANKEVFHVTLQDGAVNVQPGTTENADLIIEADLADLLHRLNSQPPSQDEKFRLKHGDEATFERFAAAFHIPN